MATDPHFSGMARVIFQDALQREEIQIRIEPQIHGATFDPGDMVRGGNQAMSPDQRRVYIVVEALRPLALSAAHTILAQGLAAAASHGRPEQFLDRVPEMIEFGDRVYRQKAEAELVKRQEAIDRLTKANEDLSARLDELRRLPVRLERNEVGPAETTSKLEQTHPRLKGPQAHAFHRQLIETDPEYKRAHTTLAEQFSTTMRAKSGGDRDWIVDTYERRLAGRPYIQQEADGSWSVYQNGGFIRGQFKGYGEAAGWRDECERADR